MRFNLEDFPFTLVGGVLIFTITMLSLSKSINDAGIRDRVQRVEECTERCMQDCMEGGQR